MGKWHRMLLTSVALLVILFVTIAQGTAFALGAISQVSPTRTVQADVGCIGDSCNNTDPVQTGCDDGSAYVVNTAPLYLSGQQIGQVDIWYSPTCGTNWAIATLSSSNCASGCVLEAQVCRTSDGYCTPQTSSSTSSFLPSTQVYAPGTDCAYAVETFDYSVSSTQAYADAPVGCRPPQ